MKSGVIAAHASAEGFALGVSKRLLPVALDWPSHGCGCDDDAVDPLARC